MAKNRVSDEQFRAACDRFLMKREQGHLNFRDQISTDAEREKHRRARLKQEKLENIAQSIERDSQAD